MVNVIVFANIIFSGLLLIADKKLLNLLNKYYKFFGGVKLDKNHINNYYNNF